MIVLVTLVMGLNQRLQKRDIDKEIYNILVKYAEDKTQKDLIKKNYVLNIGEEFIYLELKLIKIDDEEQSEDN